MPQLYKLIDLKDSRLYLKGIHEGNNYPIFTAHEENASLFNKEDAVRLAFSYNLKMVEVR